MQKVQSKQKMTMLTLLPNYQILQTLLQGPQFATFRAINLLNNQKVVIKANVSPYPSLQELAMLSHEYSLLKKMDTPGVIQAIDLIRHQNRYFLILENREGKILSDLIQKEVFFEAESFFYVAINLLDTLGQIHQHKIIHKDLKPSNILIDPNSLETTIIDFGISSEFAFELTSPVFEGSLVYISPEQTGRMNRLIDFRADFYSLGVTFYEMLSGHPPFESQDPLELVFMHLTQMPKPIANIPPLLNAILFKMMAKSAEDRYFSSDGIKQDLIRLSKGETSFAIGEKDIKFCNYYNIDNNSLHCLLFRLSLYYQSLTSALF